MQSQRQSSKVKVTDKCRKEEVANCFFKVIHQI